MGTDTGQIESTLKALQINSNLEAQEELRDMLGRKDR